MISASLFPPFREFPQFRARDDAASCNIASLMAVNYNGASRRFATFSRKDYRFFATLGPFRDAFCVRFVERMEDSPLVPRKVKVNRSEITFHGTFEAPDGHYRQVCLHFDLESRRVLPRVKNRRICVQGEYCGRGYVRC